MYSVAINSQQHQVDFTNQNKTLAKGFFNGKPFALNSVQLEKNKYHVLYQNKAYSIEIIQKSKGAIKMRVNNKNYETLVKSPFDEILATNGIQEKKEKQIKASMPGKVIKIAVKKGDTIKIGDVILVLEAMKMENSIKSNLEGKIKNILVQKNDTLAKNDTIIEFE